MLSVVRNASAVRPTLHQTMIGSAARVVMSPLLARPTRMKVTAVALCMRPPKTSPTRLASRGECVVRCTSVRKLAPASCRSDIPISWMPRKKSPRPRTRVLNGAATDVDTLGGRAQAAPDAGDTAWTTHEATRSTPAVEPKRTSDPPPACRVGWARPAFRVPDRVVKGIRAAAFFPRRRLPGGAEGVTSYPRRTHDGSASEDPETHDGRDHALRRCRRHDRMARQGVRLRAPLRRPWRQRHDRPRAARLRLRHDHARHRPRRRVEPYRQDRPRGRRPEQQRLRGGG